MKKLLAIILSVIILFVFCSCGKEIKEPTALKKGDVIEMKATKDGVDEFYKALKEELEDKDSEFSSIYDHEYTEFNKANFYNITPKTGEEKTGYKVFKDIESNSVFLYNSKEIIKLEITGFTSGLMNISLTNLNNDDCYEYVYSSTWGSGVRGQNLFVFDLKTKQVKQVASSAGWKYFCIIPHTSNDSFCYVYGVDDIEGDEANAKFTIKEKIAEIKYSSEKGFYFEPLVENITKNY